MSSIQAGGTNSRSIAALAARIGTQAQMRVFTSHTSQAPFLVPVRIVDARRVFGRYEFFVRPLGGEGEGWVGENSLTFEGDARVSERGDGQEEKGE